MCRCRGTGRHPHRAGYDMTLQRECRRDTDRAGTGGWEPGSPLTHRDTHHGTTSWSDVSGQQFLISSRFYSQCALNLFYIVATWNWSERLVTCSQDINSKVSGLSRVLFAGSFCPLDQKRTVYTSVSCFKARVTC